MERMALKIPMVQSDSEIVLQFTVAHSLLSGQTEEPLSHLKEHLTFNFFKLIKFLMTVVGGAPKDCFRQTFIYV